MSTCLLIIDVQNSYFSGPGALPDREEATLKTRMALDFFRSKKMPVIFVRHLIDGNPEGSEVHPDIAPKDGEIVIGKHFPNSFRETDLQKRLDDMEIKNLVICGMMSHMCVEAATRHAVDRGYKVTLLHDACATRDLTFNGVTVPAAHVHAAVMQAMGSAYCKTKSVDEYIDEAK